MTPADRAPSSRVEHGDQRTATRGDLWLPSVRPPAGDAADEATDDRRRGPRHRNATEGATVSQLADLKIPLPNEPRVPRHCWPLLYGAGRPTPISKALPIYWSRRGVMAHRVRSGQLYIKKLAGFPDRSRLVFKFWCQASGVVGNGLGQLAAVPPDGYPLCGTCEGRAVGAGYPGIAILQQRYELLYSPREGRAPATASRKATAS